MNASTNHIGGGTSSASASTGRDGNEVRVLATSEVDGVSGGSLLHAIGGLAVTMFLIIEFGDDIDEALTELEEWINS